MIDWKNSAKSYWREGDYRASLPLTEGMDVDVAIIGGGFSGLSTAYFLKRLQPTLRVCVVEASQVAAGASGANSGQCAPRIGPDISRQIRRFGAEVAKATYQHSLDAIELVNQLIIDEHIACEAERNGQVALAITRSQVKRLEREADAYARLGFDVRFIDSSSIKNVINTPIYKAGLEFPTAIMLNPAQLCYGLKQAAERTGVLVFESSPVMQIKYAEKTELLVNKQVVRAENVVVATNGFASQLGLYKREILPFQTSIIMTDPLSDEQLVALGWNGRHGIYDSRNLFNYFRLTKSNRLVCGGGYQYCADAGGFGYQAEVSSTIRANLQRELLRAFPSLHDLNISHSWAGIIGLTLDSFPLINTHPLNAGVYYMGGWNGHGVAQSVASGLLMANYVLGKQRDPKFVWTRNRTQRIPPLSFSAPILKLYISMLETVDNIGLLYEKPARR